MDFCGSQDHQEYDKTLFSDVPGVFSDEKIATRARGVDLLVAQIADDVSCVRGYCYLPIIKNKEKGHDPDTDGPQAQTPPATRLVDLLRLDTSPSYL